MKTRPATINGCVNNKQIVQIFVYKTTVKKTLLQKKNVENPNRQ